MAIRRTATRDKRRKIERSPVSFRLYADCRGEFDALVHASSSGREGTVARELISEALMSRRLRRLSKTSEAAARDPEAAAPVAPDLEPTDSILNGLIERLDRIESASATGVDLGQLIADRLDHEAGRLEAVSRFGAQSAAQAASLLWMLIRTQPEFADKTDGDFTAARSAIERSILEELDAAVEPD